MVFSCRSNFVFGGRWGGRPYVQKGKLVLRRSDRGAPRLRPGLCQKSDRPSLISVTLPRRSPAWVRKNLQTSFASGAGRPASRSPRPAGGPNPRQADIPDPLFSVVRASCLAHCSVSLFSLVSLGLSLFGEPISFFGMASLPRNLIGSPNNESPNDTRLNNETEQWARQSVPHVAQGARGSRGPEPGAPREENTF